MSYYVDDEEVNKEREQRHRLCRQQIIQHIKKDLLFTAFDVKWVPHTASVIVVGQYANNNGAFSLYEMEEGELKTLLSLRLRNPIKCATFGHHYTSSTSTSTFAENATSTSSSSTVAIGDFVGNLQLLDVERLSNTAARRVVTSDHENTNTNANTSAMSCNASDHISNTPHTVTEIDEAIVFHAPHAHESIINSIDGARFTGPPEIVTGSRDGAVKVWDTRQATKPVVVLQPVDKSRARDCWTVRFGNSFDPDERVIAAGYDNGDMKLFDLRTQKMIHETNISNGICDIAFDRPDIAMNKLIVSSLEGRIRIYDTRTLHPKLGYAFVEERITEGTVWCGKPLPQNREVFMCGGGGDLSLCQYKYPPERSVKDTDGVSKGVAGVVEELNKAKLGDQPINALDWNHSKEGLLACTSFDQSIRIVLVTKLSLLS